MYFVRKKGIISATECWFSVPKELPHNTPKIRLFYDLTTPYVLKKGEYLLESRGEESGTLLTDLTQAESDLLGVCDSTTRYEIRRAFKDGVECKYFSSEAILEGSSVIDQFETEYSQMHKDKGMMHTSAKPYLQQLAWAKALTITTASIDDQVVAYHTYVQGDGVARLLHSVSTFREVKSNSDRNAIARANRLLHYKDMLLFKREGYRIYDWGGYSEREDVASISSFKKGFGGKLAPSYYAKTTTSRVLQLCFRVYRKVLKF